MAKAALVLAVGVILAATLIPQTNLLAGQNPWCLVCGDRDLADAILNLILFLPLGASLVLAGVPPARAILLGTALSISIELAQAVIPGRDPSIRDVLMNSLGTASGTYLVVIRGSWFFAGDRVGAWLGLTAGGAVAATLLGLGLLMQPTFTTARYYGQWTQHRVGREFYRGRVLEASIGPVSIPDYELNSSARVRDLLAEGAEVTVRFVAGPPVEDHAPIFGIADGREREQFNVSARPEDLVFRTRAHVSGWRLDLPDVRFRGAMKSLAVGDTVSLRATRSATRWCVTVNQSSSCSEGMTAGSEWRTLYSGNSFSPAFIRFLSWIWLAGLSLPIGFWMRRSPISLLSVGLLVGAFGAVPVTGLEPGSALEWIALLAGLAIGVAAQVLLRSVRRPSVLPTVPETIAPAKVA